MGWKGMEGRRNGGGVGEGGNPRDGPGRRRGVGGGGDRGGEREGKGTEQPSQPSAPPPQSSSGPAVAAGGGTARDVATGVGWEREGRVAAAAAAEQPSQPSSTCGGGGPGMDGDVRTAEGGGLVCGG